jgi:serine/threonine-protein kinase
MIRRFSGLILYALITLFVISIYLERPETLESFERVIQDTMFRLRGERSAGDDVVIVGIDDISLEKLGDWPWNRNKIGSLADAVAEQGAKTILLDLTFEPDEYQKKAGYSDSLANTLAKAGNVVVGYYFSQAELPPPGSVLPDGLVRSAYRSISNPQSFSRYPPVGATALRPPSKEIADSSACLGFINVIPDVDRTVRRYPLIVAYRGEFYPAAPAMAAGHYLGVPQGEVGIYVGNSVVLGNRTVPTDEMGRLLVNFRGPERSFKYYSAWDIINNTVSSRELAGKLVIIGYTAFGATDIFSTPVSRNLPGVELIANVVENMVHGNTLKGVSNQFKVNIIILAIIGLFCALVLPNISLINRLVVLFLFLIVLVNMNYVLFSSFDIMTKTLYPAIQIIFMLAVAPFVRSGKSVRAGEEDDEELDYEALLSGTESIGFGVEADQTPSTDHARTAVSQASGSVGATMPITGTVDHGSVAVVTKDPSTNEVATPLMEHFGRYKILGALGKGAMGMVYKGLDPAIDRPVALKTIRLDQILEPDEASELRERLIREAKAAGQLSHPNIVTIYDVGQEGNIQYVAMEFLRGNTLESLISSGFDWDYKTLSKVVLQVCDALDYAHEHGIVHRDVKPANIMVLEGSKVKVMDFGIARVDKSASMTQTGTALGTPNYISPEQLKGQPVDRRSDIFSLSVVFYELLTGQKPFKGETLSALIYSILHTDPSAPSEVNLDVPRIFDKIVAKGLVKDPDLRFQKARDMGDILRKLV